MKKKKYKDALLIIGNIHRRDSIDLHKYDDFNWITKDITYKISDNNIIDDFFIKRELAIKKLITFLDEKNKDEIQNNYPQIPILENIKNKIYNGIKI